MQRFEPRAAEAFGVFETLGQGQPGGATQACRIGSNESRVVAVNLFHAGIWPSPSASFARPKASAAASSASRLSQTIGGRAGVMAGPRGGVCATLQVTADAIKTAPPAAASNQVLFFTEILLHGG